MCVFTPVGHSLTGCVLWKCRSFADSALERTINTCAAPIPEGVLAFASTVPPLPAHGSPCHLSKTSVIKGCVLQRSKICQHLISWLCVPVLLSEGPENRSDLLQFGSPLPSLKYFFLSGLHSLNHSSRVMISTPLSFLGPLSLSTSCF